MKRKPKSNSDGRPKKVTPTAGMDARIVQFRSRMRGTGENIDGCVGFPSARRTDGTGGLILHSHDMNGGNYKRMNGVGIGRSCKDEKGSPIQLLSAEKQSEGYGISKG